MNRQVSGALAWGGLALLIAVPSAEMTFKGHNGEAQAAEQTAPSWAEPANQSSGKGSYDVPLPAGQMAVEAPVAAALTEPAPGFKAPDPTLELPSTLPAALEASQRVAETGKPLSSDYQPIPLPFRVVGDAAEVRIAKVQRPIRVVPVHPTGPQQTDAMRTASIPANIVETPGVSTPKAAAPLQQAIAPKATPASANPYGAETGTAALEPKDIPFPAPASQRPPEPVWPRTADAGRYDASGDALSRDVRQSIENIRRARNGVAPLPPEPGYGAQSDGFDDGYPGDGYGGHDTYADYPDSYADDPFYDEYDPFNDRPSRVIIREERRQPAPRGRRYVEVWRAGSGWEPIRPMDDYPPVRDGGIRLDLTR